MDILNSRPLKDIASLRLSEARYDPRKLALIHTAVAVGVAFLLTLVNYLTQWQINETASGLSGIQMRSVWATVQMVLQTAVSIAVPFWNIGFIYAAIRMARGEKADLSSLPEGFRRFGPVLRLQLLRGLIFFGLGFFSAYAGAFVYAVSPLAFPLMEKLQPVMNAGMTVEQVQELLVAMPQEELVQLMRPALAIMGVVYAVAAIPAFYRFRMADFIIMDEPRMGAMVALLGSGQLMRRKRWKFFRLDLSFWWFYLPVALCILLSSGDVLLELAGIQIPGMSDTAWLVIYVVAQLLQLAVYWRSYSYVQTVYATAYDALRQQKPEPPKPRPVPKHLPWDDQYETQETQ